MTDHPDDPFPQAEISAILRASERPVCGGWTQLEWNQGGTAEIAFACTHGNCRWRIVIGDTIRFGLVMLAEAQYADRLHREHAWQFLDSQAKPE
jgi:hypothetical protein